MGRVFRHLGDSDRIARLQVEQVEIVHLAVLAQVGVVDQDSQRRGWIGILLNVQTELRGVMGKLGRPHGTHLKDERVCTAFYRVG